MLQDKVVLVVDDDPTLAEMYQQRLKAEGAVVEVARDGEEAIQVIGQNQPNAILLDLMMPKKSGFEVIEALKRNDQTSSIPIIVLTALVESDKSDRALELGADRYIVKSESMPADVVEVVRMMLSPSE